MKKLILTIFSEREGLCGRGLVSDIKFNNYLGYNVDYGVGYEFLINDYGG